MEIATPSQEISQQLESAEVAAWLDIWAASSPAVKSQFQLDVLQQDAAFALRTPQVNFSHFNQVLGLGIYEPATEASLDQILAYYHAARIPQIEIHVTPFTQPALLADWLTPRGLRPISAWDRVHRGPEPLGSGDHRLPGLTVEKVAEQTADEWATCLVNAYGLQHTLPIALAFAIRPGWHHYMLRHERHLLAIRSQFITTDGTAWWGVEAPVPGFMTSRYDWDYHLCGEMIADGLRLGVKRFAGEIESATPKRDHEGYRNYAALGFKLAYLRTNYSY